MVNQPKGMVLMMRLVASLGIAVAALLAYLATAWALPLVCGSILFGWLAWGVPSALTDVYGLSAMAWLVSQEALCAVLFLGWPALGRCASSLLGRRRWDRPTATSALAIGAVLVTYAASWCCMWICLWLAYGPSVTRLVVGAIGS